MNKITVRPVRIPVGNTTISGTLICSQAHGPRPAMIFIHGWHGNQTRYVRLADEYVRNGMICLAIDMRGHGISPGDPEKVTRAEHLADVLAAYDFLAKDPRVDQSRIGVFGASYGGSMAMLLSSRRPVAWLALRAPALYRDGGFDRPTARAIEALGNYRRTSIIPSRNRALKSLSTFEGDVLIVAGENDEDVPAQTIANVKKACRSAHSVEQYIITGADHGLSKEAWRTEANIKFKQWILERSQTARRSN